MSKEKKRVLYVDDENVNLQLFRLTFQNEYDVTTTDTPAEGIRLLGSNPFSIIISDMKMPKMSGIEFLTQASQLQPQTYRILVTGLLEDDSIESAVEKGIINTIVHKPWIKADLLQVLSQGGN
jgi:response regulator RpfG family c-di-GMP phosphodiesterase